MDPVLDTEPKMLDPIAHTIQQTTAIPRMAAAALIVVSLMMLSMVSPYVFGEMRQMPQMLLIKLQIDTCKTVAVSKVAIIIFSSLCVVYIFNINKLYNSSSAELDKLFKKCEATDSF